MLDEGKDLDWFSSTEVCVLAITAGSIPLLPDLGADPEYPIVDLRVFRIAVSSPACCARPCFGAFFGSTC